MSKPLSTLTLAALGALAACGPKDATRIDSSKVAQAGAGAPVSRGTFDAATHTATVYAKDFSFEAPDSIPAGLTTFHFVNEGPALHHVQLARLDSGKTVADLEAVMKNPGPPPAWLVPVGGPNAPDPGATFDASADLKEGNYVILCLVDIPDHVAHAMKGMARPLTVTAATGTAAAAPAADVTITLADYNFIMSGPLTAGKHTIRVDNKGPQAHEIEIIRLAPGKTARDFGDWLQTMQGPPPANAVGGVAATVPGTTNYASVDLTPGNYVFLCFVPDAKDGKSHIQHGMIKEVTIQ